jgi:hypothetical protein
MDYEPNGNIAYETKANNFKSRIELNGYDLSSSLSQDSYGNQKLIFTLEKDGEFTEKELRYFEAGLKKSLGSYDPHKRKPYKAHQRGTRYRRNSNFN